MANIIPLRIPAGLSADQIRDAGAYGTGAIIQVQSASSRAGSFTDLSGTGSTPEVAVVSGQEEYTAFDPAGTSSTWYRWRFVNDNETRASDWSAPEPARVP